MKGYFAVLLASLHAIGLHAQTDISQAASGSPPLFAVQSPPYDSPDSLLRLLSTAKAVLPDSTLAWAKALQQKAIGIGNVRLQAKALYIQAEAAKNTGRFLIGELFCEEGIALAQSISSDSLIAEGYNNRGNIRLQTGNFEGALADLRLSLGIRKRLGDSRGEGATLLNLGLLYYEMHNYAAAEAYLAECTKTSDEPLMLLNVLHTRANIAGEGGDFGKALQLDEQGLALCIRTNYPQKATMFYDNMANCCLFSGRPALARVYFQKCLSIDSAAGNIPYMADTYANLAELEKTLKHWKEAIRRANQSLVLSRSTASRQIELKGLSLKSDIFYRSGEKDSAYQYLLLAGSLKDSLRNAKAHGKADEFAVVYGLARKEAEIKELKQQKEIIELAAGKRNLLVAKRNAQMLSFGSLALLIAFAGIIGHKRQQAAQKRAAKNALLDAEQKERIRMARDVHDELGSGLSRISLVAGMAGRHVAGNVALDKDIATISNTSKELLDNMRDLIWVLDPENATLEELITRIREHCGDALESASGPTVFHIPEAIPDLQISREAQRNIFLTVKESVNNCMKYAGDCGMDVRVAIESTSLLIRLEDTGKGFDMVSAGSKGRGLHNMEERIAALGGHLSIDALIGRGTITTIQVPLETLSAKGALPLK